MPFFFKRVISLSKLPAMIRSERFSIFNRIKFPISSLDVYKMTRKLNRTLIFAEARKLFGGYRITPKYCKATKSSSEALDAVNNVNICMFNHECGQRNGQVVGACMDGFLFGACCQLPKDSMVGAEFLSQDYPAVSILDNNGLNSNPPSTTRKTTPMFDITSHGMSQITAALLGGNPPFSGGINSNILPTGNGNSEVVINSWSSSGVTHSVPDATINNEDNEINPIHFSSTNRPLYGDNNKATTLRYGETSLSSSGAPLGYTPVPVKQKPMFRPKPQKPTEENYVLVSTISPVKNTIDNNDALSTSASLLPFSTVRPLTSFASTARPQGTSNKPPSTSYVFSSTVPSRRTTTTSNKRRKPEKNTVKYSSSTPKPLKVSSSRPKLPSTSYVYSSTFNPTRKPPNGTYLHSSTYRPQTVAHSTYASTPEAFPSGSQSTSSSSYIPVSSTATYHPSTLTTSISGPSFSVTSRPPTAQYSGISSPAPTVIVLGSVDDQFYTTTTTSRPGGVHQLPQKKPPNHVIINNHVTQNIYNTQKPSITASSQDLPSPTVIITPKPTASSTSPSSSSSSSIVEEDLEGIVVTSSNDFINFPPDRNPNLNISHPSYNDLDLTTPLFIENDDANEKVESFVNQIIYGLQEPFNDLKDIVYNDRPNNTTTQSTQSPVGTSTKKPNKKQGTTTKRPITVRTTTKKPTTTRRSTTTRRPNNPTTTTTTRKPVTTRRPPTTIQNYIETETTPLIQQSYRDQCGARPLLKSGRIVGGRGSAFGEFPWQVLVRESTWLGLFTKNKCGGVLISDKYVITAAHCQPGFLAALVTVFGEYDISGDLESRKPVSRNVKRVVVHRKYDAATFENDLALLELESPVKFDAHIIPICLPAENTDYTKRMATVTGWGRLKYGGGVPSVLQEVQVPVMENHVCQDMFRTAGHSKVILESFLCAGYANGQKDACEGDSGGPLVVQRSDGRYELAGTVSHGIKCAAPYLPGVYMRTTYYKPWITSVTGVE